MDVTRVIARVDELGPPFRVSADVSRPDDAVSRSDDDEDTSFTWFAAAELADPASEEILRMVETHAASRGMPTARHAASLVFQRYCHRACGVAAAAWVLEGVGLDLSAGNVDVRFAGGSPDLVRVANPTGAGEASAEKVLEFVLDQHLLPIAKRLSGTTGPGLGNLMGNIAAGFAGAFRTLSRREDLDLCALRLRPRAESLLHARPELRRGGEFRVLDGPRGPRLQYDRKSCCQWYAAPDGRFCSWCSRLTQEQRTDRYLEAMAAE